MNVCIIDIDWTTGFPENALYLGGRLLECIEPEKLSIVKFASGQDAPQLLETVDQATRSEAVVIFNFDYFNLFPDQVAVLRQLAASLRKQKHVRTVACGLLPTAAPEAFLRSGHFDIVATGHIWSHDGNALLPAEGGAPRLLRGPSLACYPDDVDMLKSIRRVVNLERCLCRDELGPYFYYYTSRMCNNGCFFCINCSFLDHHGGRISKPRELVERELDFLGDFLGVRRLIIADEQTAFESLQLAVAKGYGLAQYGGRFCVRDYTPEILDFLAAHGCRTFAFPLESLRGGVHAQLKKRYTAAHVRAICAKAHELSMSVDAFYVLGLPVAPGRRYGRADLTEDLEMIAELLQNNPSVGIHARPCMPLPGSPLGAAEPMFAPNSPTSLWDWMGTIARVLNGEPLQSEAELPTVYEDRETYAGACLARATLLALQRHTSSLLHFPPKNPEKLALCNALTDHVLDLLRRGVPAAGFLNTALNHLAGLR